MKPTLTKLLAIALITLTATQTISCKKKTEAPVETTATATTEPDMTADTVASAPVEIASDDQLSNGVRDAIKDFPGVNASVVDGEVTLAGEIKRERLATLMQALHALHPKKINNNLAIK